MDFSKKKKPTIDDLVSKSGVSRSTVIRYLQGSQIRPQLQNAIDQAIGMLNYPSHRNIELGNEYSILISVPKGYNHFRGYTTIVEGILAQASKYRIKIALSDSSLQEIAVDGVMILGKDKETELQDHTFLDSHNIPHVFINRWYPQDGFSFSSVNMIKASYDGVVQLLENGCTKILAGPYNNRALVDQHKLEGYKKALQEWNVPFEESLIIKDDFYSFPESTVDGFFGFDDRFAMEFIQFSKDLGRRVPEDIKVIGMNNLDLSQFSDPALTTISLPFRTMGTTSIHLLITLLENPGCGDIKLRIPHELIKRQSC